MHAYLNHFCGLPELKMQTLVSFGGQVNTFNPGELSAQQLQKLADNMVEFVHNNNFDGIDFDQGALYLKYYV